MASVEQYGCGYQVQELRKQASELGLETKGTKAEILARIEKYLKEQGESHFMCG